ncbi:MAG: hypothetical protein J2O49_09540, partial [Sciscionella sp.]|nr:hypothetical protein [Sciscionella sp.]
RSVDAYGQRSTPVTAIGRPDNADADSSDQGAANSLVDHFDTGVVPDPRRWRLASDTDCAQASKGAGDDAERLIVQGCGPRAVALRSRTPFALSATAGGQLGSVLVDTDAPGLNGEFTIDLVPGPVALIGTDSNAPYPGTANVAQVDPVLPPGAIRVRIATAPDKFTVQVLVAPGTALIQPRRTPVSAPPSPLPGISHRWQVQLRTDGVRVLCDGVDVGGGNVVPQWKQATALFGFDWPTGSPQRAAVDEIAFCCTPSAAPPLGSQVAVSSQLINPPNTGEAVTALPGGGRPIDGATGGQLWLTMMENRPPSPGTPPITALAVTVNGHRVAARPAIAGTALTPGRPYSMVADLPANLLRIDTASGAIQVSVTPAPAVVDYLVSIAHAEVELTWAPGTSPLTTNQPDPIVAPIAQLADPSVRVANAGGRVLPDTSPLPRGRLIVQIDADPRDAQWAANRVAGLAGFELLVDNTRVLAMPLAADGPGVGGNWEVSMDASTLSAGAHTIEVREIGADARTSYTSGFHSFVLS